LGDFGLKVLVVFFVVFRKLLSFFGLGQGNCLYYPTCSEAVLSRLEEEGLFKTIPLVFKRVVMCNSIYRKFGKKWQ
tara:strand:- start:911 stop:1138 length:228 start_codon:yes stop_codon:yes gene_type:complete